MGDVPVLRSRSQILGDMLATFTTRHQIPSLKVGGPILSMLEATSSSIVRQTADMFAAVDSIDLDSATGEALDRKGEAAGVKRQRLAPASGTVDVGDDSFTKIASRVFAGVAAPIAGSTTIAVQDASLFPASG